MIFSTCCSILGHIYLHITTTSFKDKSTYSTHLSRHKDKFFYTSYVFDHLLKCSKSFMHMITSRNERQSNPYNVIRCIYLT